MEYLTVTRPLNMRTDTLLSLEPYDDARYTVTYQTAGGFWGCGQVFTRDLAELLFPDAR